MPPLATSAGHPGVGSAHEGLLEAKEGDAADDLPSLDHGRYVGQRDPFDPVGLVLLDWFTDVGLTRQGTRDGPSP